MDRGLLLHCSVCVAELATGIANANPARLAQNARPLRSPHHAHPHNPPANSGCRNLDPAGIIAGTLARCQNFAPHQRKKCLNHALIYLTATKAGLPVLTANRDAFDIIQQLLKAGAFVHF